jgi:hypothetical protein
LQAVINVILYANAEWTSLKGRQTRYVPVCNVWEGFDPDLPIQILDSHDGSYLDAAELLPRLSEENQRRCRYLCSTFGFEME